MDQKQKELNLTVFGYVRINEKKHIPTHLMDLILSYCDTFMKFMENDNCVFNTTKWKATLQKDRFGTIQFGYFFSHKDEIICTISFKMESCAPQHCGIGFITSNFNSWNHGNYFDLNNNNHSMYLYGNGFYKTSKAFDKDLKATNSFIKYQWFDNNDEISIKIDTISKDVIIWNTEIDIEQLHVDEMNYIFFTKLPTSQDVNVAIMFDMGCVPQTVSVIDQQFQFCK
eukprot:356793_1